MTGHSEVGAILICPNRALAKEFQGQVVELGRIELLEEVAEYPTPAQLEARLRQLRPTMAFVDLTEDFDSALHLITVASQMEPPVFVVGLSASSDADVIIRALRAGATEFLSPPFDRDSIDSVLQRVSRLVSSQKGDVEVQARVFAFVGVKAGQGVTTVASNVAAALSQEGKRRVLVLDFDTLGGTLSFCWRVTHSYSVIDALANAEKIDDALWGALTTTRNGVELLLGPDAPEMPTLQTERYQSVLEYARTRYEFVVIDLPEVYGPAAKAILPECDQTFIVCNSELPSLHLTRKAIAYIEQAGLPRDKFSLVVNRLSRRGELGPQDMERVFNFPIGRVLPDDSAAVHRALTAGKPIAGSADLGRQLAAFGKSLLGEEQKPKKKSATGLSFSALLSNG